MNVQTDALPAIEAINLTRRFGDFVAVDDVSFALPQCGIVALLGPNGAGKSTTMRLVTGFLLPSSGQSKLCGIDVATHRVQASHLLGYLPENGPFYPEMTPAEVLDFLGASRGISGQARTKRMAEVIELTRLADVLHKPCGALSKGFKQRVGMAGALMHDPQILVLDEPTAGLDPNQVEHVRSMLATLSSSKLIVLSTHILSEVRALAQRIIVMSKGRIVHDGSAGSLGMHERDMETAFAKLTTPLRRAAVSTA